MNDAVAAAVKAGLAVVVAAGNDNKDAKDYSPASEPLAITVGSIDITDHKASSSNYGKCMIKLPACRIFSLHIGRLKC